jgi:hydroxymethylbilane synthase
MVSGELRGQPADADTIGRALAQILRDQGAEAILAKLAHC